MWKRRILGSVLVALAGCTGLVDQAPRGLPENQTAGEILREIQLDEQYTLVLREKNKGSSAVV